MIHVPQIGVLRPALFDDGGDGPKETRAAIDFHTGVAGAEELEFKAYSQRSVKDALTALFMGKCAYCESRFDATQPVDVEHWRPKGDVEEEVQETDARGRTRTRRKRIGRGYFWLAATWENLLPSCIDCNRKRTHRILPGGEERVIGKGNFFPLAEGCTRARGQGEERDEKPLLLNPYLDDPHAALILGEEGELRPRGDAGHPADQRALPSIRVYALNRAGLVLARLEVLYEMDQHMHVFRVLAGLLGRPLALEVRDAVLDLLYHEARVLRAYTEARRPYALCARQYLNRFEEEMGLPVTPWPLPRTGISSRAAGPHP